MSLTPLALWFGIWQARPADHAGLHTHTDGGEAGAKQTFDSIFAGPCHQALPAFQQERGALITACFWEAIESVVQLAAAVVDCGCRDDIPPLLTLAADTVTADGVGGMHWSKTGAINWVGAEVDNSNLHLTLVPPTDQQSAEHRACLEMWRRREGDLLTISATRYHFARSTAADRATWCVGFWQVDSVGGMAESEHDRSQCSLYHITDIGSLAGGAKAKTARDVLELIKQQGSVSVGCGEEERQVGEWSVYSFDHPFDVKAFVKIH